jgi:hypothetical protein
VSFIVIVTYLVFFEALRDIAAQRFLGKVVTGHGMGTGPAASADVNIFASAAIVLVTLEISEAEKQFRFFPDILEWYLIDITGRLREVTAGQNFPVNIDETNELPGQTPLGAAG